MSAAPNLIRVLDHTAIREAVEAHGRYLDGKPGGRRANLSYVDLTHCALNHANLREAELTGARLNGALLAGAYAASMAADLAALPADQAAKVSDETADALTSSFQSADLPPVMKPMRLTPFVMVSLCWGSAPNLRRPGFSLPVGSSPTFST